MEEELRDELEVHLAMSAEHFTRQGYSTTDAEQLARARFGDFDDARRRLYRTALNRERALHRRQHVEDLRRDLQGALRQMRTAPGFYAAAILTLALGIGANGAVFSILRATLLEPLPYRDPSSVYMIWRAPRVIPPGEPPRIQAALRRGGLTPAQVLGWRDESRDVLTDVAAIQLSPGSLAAQFDVALSDRALRLRGALVTPNFFDILGTRTNIGRAFSAADESSGAPLIVLSHGLWQHGFGADRGVVGRKLTLITGSGRSRGPRTFTVLGVLPPTFRFTYPDEIEAWAMMPWSDVRSMPPASLAFRAVGRLRSDRTAAQADAAISRFPSPFQPPNTPREQQRIMRLEPIREWVVGETRSSLYLLAGVSGLLLVMTCATVANGLLARIAERQRELAVRASLGADRGRLVRQLLTEGATLAVQGAAIGTIIAIALQPVLRALLPSAVPRVAEIGVDVSVLAFAVSVAALTTILAGLAPAWSGSRSRTTIESLRVSARASASRSAVRWRQGLIVLQSAVATSLLIGAGLLIASLWRLGRVPLGFDGDRVLTVEMRLLGNQYRPAAARAAFQEQLLERVRAIPGVTDVGLTSAVPFRGVDFYLTPSGPVPGRRYSGNGRYVDAGYFSVLRIPLRRGRLFTDGDREGAPRVVIVSESYARNAFGAEDPIGKEIDIEGPVQVVGVVGDLRYVRFDEAPLPALYIPRAQSPSELVCLVARTSVPISAIAPSIHRAVREIDPTLPAMNLTTVDRIIEESIANRRFYTVATLSFASLALVLTIAGLTIVVARVVTERRREFAIRSALGASGRQLMSTAVAGGLGAVLWGLVVGIAAAAAGSSILAQFLFEVPPRSLPAFGAVAALVVGAAIAAASIPAARLLRLPLSASLRTE